MSTDSVGNAIKEQLDKLYAKNAKKQAANEVAKVTKDPGVATAGQRNFASNFGRMANGFGTAVNVGAAIDMAKKIGKKGPMAGYADAVGLETKDPTKDYE
jgi:hypothetical protein